MKKNALLKVFLSTLLLTITQPAFTQAQDYISNLDSCCASECCGESKWLFQADFLYWTTDFNAISSIDASIQAEDSVADATIQISHPKPKWDPGVRLTAGWIGPEQWDIQASWTNFYNSKTNSTAPFILQVATDNLGTSGNSKFTFRYNAANLEVGNTLALSSFLTIRPFAGIHALWINSDSKLFLVAPPMAGMTLQTDGFTANLNLNKRSWAVGPRLGINTSWGNFNGFSLVGNVSGALVYGKQQAKVNAEVDITSAVDINIHLRGDSRWHSMSTVQMQAGVAYTGNLCNNEFRISALWECNTISQANNVLIFERSISTQGLTLNLEYLF